MSAKNARPIKKKTNAASGIRSGGGDGGGGGIVVNKKLTIIDEMNVAAHECAFLFNERNHGRTKMTVNIAAPQPRLKDLRRRCPV